jgi:hypothetical protein
VDGNHRQPPQPRTQTGQCHKGETPAEAKHGHSELEKQKKVPHNTPHTTPQRARVPMAAVGMRICSLPAWS